MIWLDCRAGSEAEVAPLLPRLEEAGVSVTFDHGRRMLAQLPARCRHVYLVRIDSDDMYAPDAIEQVRRLQCAAAPRNSIAATSSTR